MSAQTRLNKLNAATDARKARLAALKSLKRKAPSDSTSAAHPEPSSPPTALTNLQPPSATTPPEDQPSTAPYLSGRNYDPATRAPKLGFDTLPAHLETAATLEKRAHDLHIAVRSEQAKERADEPLDLFKLQPKRPNWDLKRDLREKYQGLEAETERAIARLVRERVEGGKKAVGEGEREEVGMEGVALVEAMHRREREGE
ncbi:uncharacterized protein BDZ99DRAFT_417988, partial [Mytilinidion resinicola]